jgi:hypothetical protein
VTWRGVDVRRYLVLLGIVRHVGDEADPLKREAEAEPVHALVYSCEVEVGVIPLWFFNCIGDCGCVGEGERGMRHMVGWEEREEVLCLCYFESEAKTMFGVNITHQSSNITFI